MTKEALKLALEALESKFLFIAGDGEAVDQRAKAITAIKEALAQPELTLDGLTPMEFALRELYEFQEATGCDSAAEFKAQPEQEPVANEWSVFNTGAEVASGLSLSEAWDYLTPERLERGWSAVCVLNKDNQPTSPPQRNKD